MQDVLNDIGQIFAEYWTDLQLIKKAPQIGIAIIILIIGLVAARLIKSLVARALNYREADEEVTVLVARIVQWVLVSIGILIAADQIGLDITALLTGLGILGFTLGFALQDVSKNFIAGMLILIQQPFKLGDKVEISGFTGTVLAVNLRDTELRAVDGLNVRIPNGDVFTSSIINYSHTQSRRIQISTGVTTNSDLEQVRQTALEAIKSINGVLDNPAVDFHFTSFGENSIDLTIYYWYDESKTGYSGALDSGITSLKIAFDKAGIIMPGREQTIYVVQSQSGEEEIRSESR